VYIYYNRLVVLSSITFRLALGPTQRFFQWIPAAISPGLKYGKGVKAATPSSAEVGGAILPLCHTSSWRSAQLIKLLNNYIYFYILSFLGGMFELRRIKLGHHVSFCRSRLHAVSTLTLYRLCTTSRLLSCKIRGSRGGNCEDCYLLRCDAV
jgi:hypothetical protein